MQQNSWKVFEKQKIKMEPFKIEMLFEYKEPGGELDYNWCQGVVVKLIRQNDKSAVVEIKWNNDTAGGLSITQEELKKIIRSAKQVDNYGASNIVLPCPGS
jgi:hypothetical protein